jgi:hypothetical protein
MAEAEHVAALTCQEVDLVLAQVEALDRDGRRLMLIDWLSGEPIPHGGPHSG